MPLNNNPNLIVAARPTNTYINPGTTSSAALELYDEQQVRLALEFSDAFANLSASAARLAGNLKQEWNKEDFEAGKDLVRKNQQTYISLVEEGKIKPSENPWLALGAQEASGVMEGQKARVEFQALYNKQALENPNFFTDRNAFDALASSFMTNKETLFKDSMYLRRAFHESFDSVIPQMGLAHEKEITERRIGLVVGGVNAKVRELVVGLQSTPEFDFKGWSSAPEYIRLPLEQAVQEHEERSETYTADLIGDFKEWIQQSPEAAVGRGILNSSIINSLIEIREEGDYAPEAQYLMETLNLGSGLLFETQEARGAVAASWDKIRKGDTKFTEAKRAEFDDALNQFRTYVLNSKNTGLALGEMQEGLNRLIGSFPVDETTGEYLRNRVSSEIAALRTQQQVELSSRVLQTIQVEVDSYYREQPLNSIEIKDVKARYRKALYDSLKLVLDANGISPNADEQMKLMGRMSEQLDKYIDESIDRGYIWRGEVYFGQNDRGNNALRALETRFNVANIGRIYVETQPEFAALGSIIENAAVRAATEPEKQDLIRDRLWDRPMAAATERLKELRDYVEGGNLKEEQVFAASEAAESLYSIIINGSLRTGKSRAFNNLLDGLVVDVKNYNIDKPVDPLTSALIRSFAQISPEELKQLKAGNQKYEAVETLVGVIRDSVVKRSLGERAAVQDLASHLQRVGPNFYTDARITFAQENRDKFWSLVTKELTSRGIKSEETQERFMDPFARIALDRLLFDEKVDIWVENVFKKFDELFYKINEGYVLKNELHQAFVTVDERTGKTIAHDLEDAAYAFKLVFTQHPAFKDYEDLTFRLEEFPITGFSDIEEGQHKYQVVNKLGQPMLKEPLTLREFYTQYFKPFRLEFIRKNEAMWNGFNLDEWKRTADEVKGIKRPGDRLP